MGRLLLIPTFCMEDMDMLDTIWDMLDTTASVKLMLSQRPRLLLILIFFMEDMDMLVTLAMLDTMDSPMLDMPTMDKLQPPTNRKRTEQPSFFYSSVTTKFQCLTCFLVTDGRKHRESNILNK